MHVLTDLKVVLSCREVIMHDGRLSTLLDGTESVFFYSIGCPDALLANDISDEVRGFSLVMKLHVNVS